MLPDATTLRRAIVGRRVAKLLWIHIHPTDRLLLKDRFTDAEFAAIDDRIEAMLTINERGRETVEFVEPNHRHGNLWRVSAHGQSRVVTDRALLMLAGIDAPLEPDPDPAFDEVF